MCWSRPKYVYAATESSFIDYQAGVSAKQLAGRDQAMTENETDHAVKLYVAGPTIAEVAAALGRLCSTIQTALAQRGVPRRTRHDYT
jgi:hypothetical protein